VSDEYELETIGSTIERSRSKMNELVEMLVKAPHPVIVERSNTAAELQEQIDRGYVLVKFTDTKGGTELGTQLDMSLTRLDEADFENEKGAVHLVGNLTLNYDRVQLAVDIDLSTLEGTGQLVLLEEGQ